MRRERAIKITVIAFVTIIAIAIVLLLLEVGYRLSGKYPVSGMEYSDTEIWHWRSNMCERSNNEELDTFIVHTDQFGFRNVNKTVRKPDNVIRILVLGDSYTSGMNVADNKVFPALLEKELSQLSFNGKEVEVIGASSPAWSTEQELRCLLHESLRFKPDQVLLMASPNDIRESYCKKFAVLDAEGNVRYNPIKFNNAEILGWWLSNHSCFYQYLQRKVLYTEFGSFNSLQKKYSFTFGKGDETNWDRPIFLKAPLPPVDSAKTLFKALVSKMNDECKANNIKFAISLIPAKMEFDGTMNIDTTMQAGLISDQFKDLSSVLHVPYINLYDQFKSDSVPMSHFLKTDYHFSAKGHRVTANALAEYYKEALKQPN